MIKVKLVVRQGLCVRSAKFLSINPSFEPNNCKMPTFTSQFDLSPARSGHAPDMRTLAAGGWRSVEQARQRRVFWLLTAAWLVNVFDLFFTQIALIKFNGLKRVTGELHLTMIDIKRRRAHSFHHV